MIQNPNPIAASTFNGMWIQNAQFISESKLVQASLLPYDGTHLLATGRKMVNKKDEALVASVAAEAKRLSGKDAEVKLVRVMAPEPSKPVMLQVIFADNSVHMEKDCYAKAAQDAVFAEKFNATLNAIATLAGLTVA